MSSNNLWSPNFIYSCTANFLMGFSFYLLMPTLPYYLVDAFDADKTTIGVVVSCYVIAALLIRPFSGFLVDSFSRRSIYIISFGAFVAFTIGYLAVDSIAAIIVLRFFHGLTWGVITTAGNTLAIDVMPADKRGRGIGYYGMALNLSMAIGPMVGLFLQQRHPFSLLFWLAIATGFMGLITAYFIRPLHPHARQPHRAISLDRFLMLRGIPLGINVVMITLSYGMILSFSALYSADMGASNPGLFFTLLAIGLGVARAFSGTMIDNGHIRRASLLGIAILASCFTLFVSIQNPAIYYISALIIGVGYGVVFPAFQTGFVNMASHHERGTANSTFLTAFDIGVGLGMLLAGKIAESFSLAAAFGVSAALCFLGLVYYLLLSKTKTSQQ
ncbi:MAG: MFS transporter [Marinilabiliaceae bacterium]|nr:MFS transporter [Marinilabiliaceae bacterium]